MSETLVITGGSRGIGLATARLFLARGARVVNLARTACPLPEAIHLPVDLSQADFLHTIQASLSGAVETSERIVLVHNACVLENDEAARVDEDGLARSLAVGVTAPAFLNRLLVPLMRPGSAIIYVGSTLSEKAVAGLFSYVTVKHAVVGMMRATCQDLLGTGIHTACVCPGVTDTEMLRQRTQGRPEVLDELRSMTGAGRLIEPEEIARVIADAADQPVLNGAVLHANLGQRER
ncbi:MAG TPA: SDR family oxidoreductase [Blastocatellia bacterium]|nr:SDR family oxidoreductase [Blastocatellia bacterium]HMV83153.1 SDR family oxidoreductase [Blastocatellia bacterium]HMX24448.1 SDR family oxidoreductase [Blastocatellia bacterium]HMY74409.1 SDR family oxidoreductase [Blastocatellia bacterium]HMZ21885.1 SDR family oxidoreductase [Blastocatellia bacterium]